MKSFFFVLLFILLAIVTSATAADRVQDVKAMQQGNRMVLEYTLTGDKLATVSFSVIANGKKYIADSLHLEGDYGKNIAPGKRRLVWNVLQDFPRGLHEEIDWELSAAALPDINVRNLLDSTMKIIGVIQDIQQMGRTAIVVLKDIRTGQMVSVTIIDMLTIDKIKDKRIVKGDEIRCKYETISGENKSLLFRKTAGQ